MSSKNLGSNFFLGEKRRRKKRGHFFLLILFAVFSFVNISARVVFCRRVVTMRNDEECMCVMKGVLQSALEERKKMRSCGPIFIPSSFFP